MEGGSGKLYEKWAISIDHLLGDKEGIVAFKEYMKTEGYEDMFNFYFACEGLKQQSEEIAKKVISILCK